MASTERRLRVLAVEDEEDMRRLYELSLTADGFDVVTAADLSEALERLAEEVPDAMILDMVMSSEEKPSLLEILHGDPRTRSVPVVVVSGVTKGHRQWTETGPWDLYVTKPVDLRSLAGELRRLIASR